MPHTDLAREASEDAHLAAMRPNVVYIIADDLGYGDLGSFGHPDIRTPNLDALAAQGVRLTQMYSPGAVCSPSRVGWITGRYPGRLAAGNAEPLGSQDEEARGVTPGESTLTQSLKRAGYDLALFGKWHLGYPPDHSPVLSGFDEFWGVLDGVCDYLSHAASGPTPDSYGLFAGDNDTDAPGKVVPVHAEGYLTDLIGDRAVDYLQRRAGADAPFYLGVHFTAPHWPWLDRDDHEESRRLSEPETWQGGWSLYHSDGGSLAKYYEIVRIMDENIGRILDALDAAGLAEDTLVIFTSDNGGERYSYMWPYIGQKATVWEGGYHVPGVMRWPARLPAATSTGQLVTLLDVTAALLAAAGVEADQPLDGVDVLPILAGEAPDTLRTMFWRQRPWGPSGQIAGIEGAARHGDLKYVREADGSEHLFDLGEDPHEKADVARRRPDELSDLRARWERWNAELVPYGDDLREH